MAWPARSRNERVGPCGAKEDKADTNRERRQNQELDGKNGTRSVAAPFPGASRSEAQGQAGQTRARGGRRKEINPTEKGNGLNDAVSKSRSSVLSGLASLQESQIAREGESERVVSSVVR